MRFVRFAFLIGCLSVTFLGACGRRADRPGEPNDTSGLAELPFEADVVLSVSLAQLREQRGFDSLVLEARARLRPVLALVQSECHFDPLALVDSVVLANDRAAGELALALVRGRFTRAQIDDCVARVATADRGKSVVARREGRISAYAAAGETLELHVVWLGDGLVLIPFANLTERAYVDGLLRAPRRLSQQARVAELVREASAGGAAAWLVAAPADGGAGVAPWLRPALAVAFGAPVPRQVVSSVTFGGGISLRARVGFASAEEATSAAHAVRAHTGRLSTLDASPRGLTVEIAASLDDGRLRGRLAELLDGPPPPGP